MAHAERRSVKGKGTRTKRARARRVAVAAEKSRPRAKSSGPRAKAAGKEAAARPAAAEPRPAKARARTPKAAKPAAAAAPATARTARKPAALAPTERPGKETAAPAAPPDERPAVGLTDEEQIESAKYQPRRAKPRVFEEERFLFPQSYGVNRLRLLVKDPQWLFAYWDVDPRSLETLRAELGSRATALSQLTLRVFEDRSGGASTFLVPQDARTWYVPARTTGRAYRAEVGVILPTGEFRPLARSNSVVAPRVGRSAQKAKRRVRYDRARALPPGAAVGALDEDAPDAERAWDAPLDPWSTAEEEPRLSARERDGRAGERGGASDLHRR